MEACTTPTIVTTTRRRDPQTASTILRSSFAEPAFASKVWQETWQDQDIVERLNGAQRSERADLGGVVGRDHNGSWSIVGQALWPVVATGCRSTA